LGFKVGLGILLGPFATFLELGSHAVSSGWFSYFFERKVALGFL
jgi:hypothetical protein